MNKWLYNQKPYISRAFFLALPSIVTQFYSLSSQHVSHINDLLSEHKLCSGRETPKIDIETKMNTNVYSPNVSASSKKFHFDFMRMYCAGTFLLCPHCLLYLRTCLYLPGVGLCLCFKLKRLKTSDLWTSAWPTWVQVGSLIITSPPTSWRTFMLFCASLSPVCWCAWQAMSAAEERKKSCVLQ